MNPDNPLFNASQSLKIKALENLEKKTLILKLKVSIDIKNRIFELFGKQDFENYNSQIQNLILKADELAEEVDNWILENCKLPY